MSNSVFVRLWEKMRKHRDIELVTTEKRRNCVVSEPNYLATKLLTKNLSVIEMRKTQTYLHKYTCLFTFLYLPI